MSQHTNAAGFMVWCPEKGMPNVAHDTIESAVAEAERLTRLYPPHRFLVMSPLESAPDIIRAKVWGDGRKEGREEGLAEAHRAIMEAEAKTDRAYDKIGDLNSDLRRFKAVGAKHRAFQAVVADCLLWFDGFTAAYAGREPFERPNVPARETLRQLNAALMGLEPPSAHRDLDHEIPF